MLETLACGITAAALNLPRSPLYPVTGHLAMHGVGSSPAFPLTPHPVGTLYILI